jgi:hypothetical protein
MDANRAEVLRWLEERLSESIHKITAATGSFYGKLWIVHDECQRFGTHSRYVDLMPFNNPSLHPLSLDSDICQNGVVEISVGYCCGSNYISRDFQFKPDLSDFFADSEALKEIESIWEKGCELLINLYRDPKSYAEYWDCPEPDYGDDSD